MTLSEEAAEIEAMRKRVRNEALEEAAAYHDERAANFNRKAQWNGETTDFFRQKAVTHTLSALAIRALKDKP